VQQLVQFIKLQFRMTLFIVIERYSKIILRTSLSKLLATFGQI